MTVRTAVAAADGDDQPAARWITGPDRTTMAACPAGARVVVPARPSVLPVRSGATSAPGGAFLPTSTSAPGVLPLAAPTNTTTVVWWLS